ncbi:MAG: hypothetical protein AAF519_12970 [Bacteroidota bacterium]
MIDTLSLDADLRKLIDKKLELNDLDYSHSDYDHLEEEVHHLEDTFQANYGDYLDEAFHQVHDEYCPDNDVLLSIAYIPDKVIKDDSNTYHAAEGQGVYIEVDEHESSETKLVLLPGPTRIELLIDSEGTEVVWKSI